MTYFIDVTYMEIQALAKVTISDSSEYCRSTRESQFQCIGWILNIVKTQRSKVDDEWLVNPDYAVEALVSIAGLTYEHAVELIAMQTVKEQFRFVWELLDDDERDLAINLNYEAYDNFWPSFDVYNIAWAKSAARTKSGNPAAAEAPPTP